MTNKSLPSNEIEPVATNGLASSSISVNRFNRFNQEIIDKYFNEQGKKDIHALLIKANTEQSLSDINSIIEVWQSMPDEGTFTNYLFDIQDKLKRKLKYGQFGEGGK